MAKAPNNGGRRPLDPWVALVGPEIEENLSLRYLTSSLEASGFHTEILPFNGPGDFSPLLERIMTEAVPPFPIGVSMAFQRRAMDFAALAVALREPVVCDPLPPSVRLFSNPGFEPCSLHKKTRDLESE